MFFIFTIILKFFKFQLILNDFFKNHILTQQIEPIFSPAKPLFLKSHPHKISFRTHTAMQKRAVSIFGGSSFHQAVVCWNRKDRKEWYR